MVSLDSNFSDSLMVGLPGWQQSRLPWDRVGSTVTPSLSTPMSWSGEQSESTDPMRKTGLREGKGEQW